MENYNHEQIHYETETGMRCDVHSTHGFFVAKHWHNSLEIIMVLDGNMDISISGRNIRLESGGLAVINSRTIHSTGCRSSCRYLLLQIPYEVLKKNIPDIEMITIRCVCPVKSMRKGHVEETAHTLEKLAALYESPRDGGYLLMFNSLVYELLYHLVIHFKVVIDPALKKQSDKNVQRLGVVLQYVRQHYNESISLEDAARLVAFNREYFSRFFKKYMGITFMDYVFAIRLEYAYNDIINTDYPIVDIIENNGFGKNYKLFLRKFREQYGCSPGEKRKQLAENQPSCNSN